MKEILNQLIDLYHIDNRLQEIELLKGDLPVTVQKQKSELNEIQSDNEKKIHRINEINSDIKNRQNEIDDFSIKLKKYKDQIYLVKSNKEYEALSVEIEHMKKTISESEGIILDLEIEKADLCETIEFNENSINEINKVLDINQISLNKSLEETQSEEKNLDLKRKKLLSKIEPSLLMKYENISSSRGGLGMASIRDKACGGCYSQLPQQTILEIKKNSEIYYCPSCGLLLFWDGAETF